MAGRVIGVDLDGVLASIAVEFCKYYNEKYETNISVSDIKSYKAEEWTGKPKEEIHEIFKATPIFETVEPIVGSVESLETLKANEWIIHVVTHRPWYPALQDLTKQWLRDHGFVFDFLHLSETS